jgi:ribonucleoside-diphosphate reductase alpha chain
MTKEKLTKIVKRDGKIVPFDRDKITNAIFKAALAAGGRDREEAERLSGAVVSILEKSTGKTPTVEEVQDIVEKVLIEEGHARTAKAYILYRQQRAELRKEKRRVLEKEKIDEVDKKLDLNSLRVLKARYLRKNEEGKLIETPKDMFTRVSVHVTLPNLLYNPEVFDIKAKQTAHPTEAFEPEKHENKYSIGAYKLNRYHLEALKRTYDRMSPQRYMKVSWSGFLGILKKGTFKKHEKDVEEFYNLMVTKRFMPNTPAIANFGNPLGMGSACFVMDVDDSIHGIMDTLKNTALVFKAGGGMGYNFSKIRPHGDYVSTTSGIASGPISFMRLFDTMTEVINQGGIRRGANMGILNSNHPDVEKFIKSKEGNQALKNFNISVMIMDDFWDHYEKNEPYLLTNPRSGEVVREINAKRLFDMIVYHAWESAEPGVIYYEHVNKYNPFLDSLGPIVTTNPCGEVLLYPNESCNLGSINVWAFVREDMEGDVHFDWDALKETVKLATRFLDNIIDINKFPLPQIEKMSLNTRKVGLGVMGVADLLYDLKIAYNSEEGRSFMGKLMEFINYHSKVQSIELAKERAPFPYFDKSFFTRGRLPIRGFDHPEKWHFDWKELAEKIRKHGIRNSYTTVIAPTGSISMIAGCSSGIEPVYSLAFEKHVKVGSFYYIDPVFERAMKAEGLYDERLMEEVAESRGSIQTILYIPPGMKKIFVTAMDMTPDAHIRALATFQMWVDSSISKTINFPADATVDDMRESYLLAHKLGCKDVTVFRDTSIKGQVLVTPKREREEEQEVATAPPPAQQPTPVGAPESCATLNPASTTMEEKNASTGTSTLVRVPSTKYEFKYCPECETELAFKEGCVTCPDCGWGLCK